MYGYYVVYDWEDESGWVTRGVEEYYPTFAEAIAAYNRLKLIWHVSNIAIVQ